MSNNTIPSMEALPVELLHRIFDNLDAQTIVFSVRPVCRFLRSVVKTYDRHIFDSKLISKLNFYALCRLIHPHNFISLILSNDELTSNQIDLFISLVRLRQLTRLRSLTLLNIDESQLNFILKRINLAALTFFSCTIRKYDDRRRKTTNELLTSIIAQSSLEKIEFDIKSERMLQISWPINCTIQYLTINGSITTDNLFTILQYSPYLHTIILKESCNKMINNITVPVSPPQYFRQLRSLTMEKLDVTIDKLESFLLLTPSLVYLKLIGGKNMLDGKPWEQFIEINLPHLDKFEFYFVECSSIKKTEADLELIIASFRTPFWIEHKKWFVICDCDMNLSNTIHLYSLPICKAFLIYEMKSQKLSLSNYNTTRDNHRSIMNNVNSLQLFLEKPLTDHIQEKKTIGTHPLFPKVTEIDLQFRNDWPLFSLQSLSMFIDIPRIVQMKLNTFYFKLYDQKLLMDIGIFMQQALNLSSLIIDAFFFRDKSTTIIKHIHFIIPHNVKHLQIPINNLDQIKTILERCQNLSTIKFDIPYSKFSIEVIKWFADNTIDSTCQKDYKTVAVWLGKKNIQPIEIELDNKRIKLHDNRSDS